MGVTALEWPDLNTHCSRALWSSRRQVWHSCLKVHMCEATVCSQTVTIENLVPQQIRRYLMSGMSLRKTSVWMRRQVDLQNECHVLFGHSDLCGFSMYACASMDWDSRFHWNDQLSVSMVISIYLRTRCHVLGHSDAMLEDFDRPMAEPF